MAGGDDVHVLSSDSLRSQKITQGEAESQGKIMDLQRDNPPGADRDLYAVRGRQRGFKQTRETAGDTGTRSGVQS